MLGIDGKPHDLRSAHAQRVGDGELREQSDGAEPENDVSCAGIRDKLHRDPLRERYRIHDSVFLDISHSAQPDTRRPQFFLDRLNTGDIRRSFFLFIPEIFPRNSLDIAGGCEMDDGLRTLDGSQKLPFYQIIYSVLQPMPQPIVAGEIRGHAARIDGVYGDLLVLQHPPERICKEDN
jgi:hypothetical protein